MEEEELSLGLDVFRGPQTKRYVRLLKSRGYVEHADSEDGPWEPIPPLENAPRFRKNGKTNTIRQLIWGPDPEESEHGG